MPGPRLDLIGEEEIAEVAAVLRTHHLSRFGSDDDPIAERFCDVAAEIVEV